MDSAVATLCKEVGKYTQILEKCSFYNSPLIYVILHVELCKSLGSSMWVWLNLLECYVSFGIILRTFQVSYAGLWLLNVYLTGFVYTLCR